MTAEYKLVAAPDYVVLRVPEPEQRTGGIYLPKDNQMNETEGIVESIGKAAKEWLGTEIGLGDMVIVRRFSGNITRLQDKAYIVVGFKEILAIRKQK